MISGINYGGWINPDTLSTWSGAESCDRDQVDIRSLYSDLGSNLDTDHNDVTSASTGTGNARKTAEITTKLSHLSLASTMAPSDGNLVKLRIRNERFMVFKCDLQRAPRSRLATLTRTDPNYDPETEEFVFNRNPINFHYIMDYYVTGKLHFPTSMCVEMVRGELEFWRLEVDHIATCCRDLFLEALQKKRLVQIVRKEMTPLWQEVEDSLVKRQTPTSSGQVKPGDTSGDDQVKTRLSLRLRLWLLLEDPSYSRGALAWSLVFFAVILLSNLVLCLETLPYFRQADNATWETYHNLSQNKVMFMVLSTLPSEELRAAEIFTVVVLFLDLLCRFSLCPDKCRFCYHLLNIVQVVVIIPNFVELGFALSNSTVDESIPSGVLIFLGILRLLRVTLILRSAKGYPSLKILGLSILGSWRELILMIFLLLISVFIFSFLLFYAEISFSDNIQNIGVAIWWAMITMTTVGYGDYVPKSVPGIVVGNVCAVCGILLIALPVAVIGNNFNQYYTAMSRHQRTKAKRQQDVKCL